MNGHLILEWELICERYCLNLQMELQSLLLKKIYNDVHSVLKKVKDQIKEKESDTEFRAESLQAEGDIKEAKDEITQQIEVNRNQLKSQIDEIRKEARKRRETL